MRTYFKHPTNFITGEENQVAPSGKKRRRRSVPELGRKVKRQTVSNTEDTMEIGVTRDRTFVSKL